ncbi:hypothetical protein AVEN_37716-1 [Araneus ventricosus]|uniref:Uncharacterized protein n=1 Tax=Araneus ventricosus TaxID=182803 RepID=A0A4Y2BVV7_ARAVE|nr:hypothetical protein AVEN_37716-1 [Araneus ventricosus]
MEMSLSLFFGLDRNFSQETVRIIASSNITSLDIRFCVLLAHSAHLVPPTVSFSGYPSNIMIPIRIISQDTHHLEQLICTLYKHMSHNYHKLMKKFNPFSR